MADALPRSTPDNAVSRLAEGYLDCDLNRRFISKPAATYLFPSADDGIEGIFKGDMLIVDRSITPKPGAVVIADIGGEYAIRRLVKEHGKLLLVDDKGYTPPLTINETLGIYHGTVTASIHSHSW
jgi:DNA polymerase V